MENSSYQHEFMELENGIMYGQRTDFPIPEGKIHPSAASGIAISNVRIA